MVALANPPTAVLSALSTGARAGGEACFSRGQRRAADRDSVRAGSRCVVFAVVKAVTVRLEVARGACTDGLQLAHVDGVGCLGSGGDVGGDLTFVAGRPNTDTVLPRSASEPWPRCHRVRRERACLITDGRGVVACRVCTVAEGGGAVVGRAGEPADGGTELPPGLGRSCRRRSLLRRLPSAELPIATAFAPVAEASSKPSLRPLPLALK